MCLATLDLGRQETGMRARVNDEHLMRRRSSIGRRLIRSHALFGTLLFLAGCASIPPEANRESDLEKTSPLPKAIFVEVELTGLDGRFDDSSSEKAEQRWEARIREDLEKLNVAAAVRCEKEVDRRSADLRAVITLRRPPEDSLSLTEVDDNGALLDFLAWSTVPLLPLWIEDVRVDPGIRFELQLFRRERRSESSIVEEPVLPQATALPTPAISTCMLDRYPFPSWAILGAIFVPPFLFEEGEAEHLWAAIEERVQQEIALAVAGEITGEIRNRLGRDELLTGFSMKKGEEGWIVSFSCREDVGRIRYRLGERSLPARLRETGDPRDVTLTIGPEQAGDSPLLRVIGDSVDPDGKSFSYTVCLGDGELEYQ